MHYPLPQLQHQEAKSGHSEELESALQTAHDLQRRLDEGSETIEALRAELVREQASEAKARTSLLDVERREQALLEDLRSLREAGRKSLQGESAARREPLLAAADARSDDAPGCGCGAAASRRDARLIDPLLANAAALPRPLQPAGRIQSAGRVA